MKQNDEVLTMSIMTKSEFEVKELLREWEVLIDEKHYKLKLEYGIEQVLYGQSVQKLRLWFENDEFEIFVEKEKIFEFCNHRFFFRVLKNEKTCDLFMDGILIYPNLKFHAPLTLPYM